MSHMIFITGGVVSSLGKGVVSAASAATIESRGYKVTLLKLDPYINVDPGTMSPYQHGEVFVTKDGAETDLDLGHYERFLNTNITINNSFTAGKVYETVLKKERKGDFLGSTVQVIPHITDEIKQRIYNVSEGYDFIFVEIGGTVGDIESLPFLEAVRQIKLEQPYQCISIHLTWVPYLKAAGEIKTKPTQHSVKELRSIGLIPDILICRSEKKLEEATLNKVASLTSVPANSVFNIQDIDNIYKLPIIINEKKLDEAILQKLSIENKTVDLSQWHALSSQLTKLKGTVKIAIIGKYPKLTDSYKSLIEALKHSCYKLFLKPDITVIGSDVDPSVGEGVVDTKKYQDYHIIVVPGGFGERGVSNKINAIKYAREHKIPFLGICMGMQLAVIEYSRHVIGMPGANSREFIATDDHQASQADYVVDTMDSWTNPSGSLIKDQKSIKRKGGTMRLGEQNIHIEDNSLAQSIYERRTIKARHRHRYEVNPKYIDQLKTNGLKISGYSDDDFPEIIELSAEDHPFFIAVQFHPEFDSKPTKTNPLFDHLISSAIRVKEALINSD